MSTLVELVADAAHAYGERTALVMRAGLRDERWSYSRLWQAVNAVADHLRGQMGLQPGDRVLLCAPNQPRLVASLLGAMRARVIPVPLDPFTSPEFAARVARDTEAAILIADRPLALPGMRLAALRELPFDAQPRREHERPTARDIAEIVYTSGTTGRPKGVVLTHANIRANALAADRLTSHTSAWRLLSLLPLSHMLEQTVGLYAQLLRGSTVVYGVAHHPAAITKALRRYRIVAMVAVPQLLAHMLRALEQEAERRGAGRAWRRLNLLAEWLPMPARRLVWRGVLRELGGALELFMCGGAALTPEVQRAWERLGVGVMQGYGATECSPIVAGNSRLRRVTGSVGRAVYGVQVRLSPEGEVQVRGASVSPGYWHNDAATSAAFTPDGWYRTGDLAEADAKGNLYIKGRLKDMVVLPSGLKVFLEDIEDALRRQAGVRDCVVLDVPLPAGGVAFTAVVIGEGGDTALRAANAELAPHQRLSGATAWDAADFPRTALGKVKRAEVRAWLERARAPAAPSAHESKETQLVQLLSEVSGVEATRIAPTSDLNLDLALTSLARVELALALEERFGAVLDDGDLAAVETVAQLAALVERGPGAAGQERIPTWPLRAPARAAREVLQRTLLFPLHALLARPFRVQGRERLQGMQLPALFVANHSSHVDTVSIVRALPRHIRRRIAVAAAADYFYRFSVVGWFTSLALNTFPFSREGAVRGSLEHCGELADQGWSVLVYPEGTRSPSGALLPFKSGIGLLAAGLDVPVVPIAVLGGHAILPKGRAWPRPAPLRVVFGAPLHLAGEAASARAPALLQRAVADLMGVQ
jgi:long-chain acyl-CoA synthetase